MACLCLPLFTASPRFAPVPAVASLPPPLSPSPARPRGPLTQLTPARDRAAQAARCWGATAPAFCRVGNPLGARVWRAGPPSAWQALPARSGGPTHPEAAVAGCAPRVRTPNRAALGVAGRPTTWYGTVSGTTLAKFGGRRCWSGAGRAGQRAVACTVAWSGRTADPRRPR